MCVALQSSYPEQIFFALLKQNVEVVLQLQVCMLVRGVTTNSVSTTAPTSNKSYLARSCQICEEECVFSSVEGVEVDLGNKARHVSSDIGGIIAKQSVQEYQPTRLPPTLCEFARKWGRCKRLAYLGIIG